MRWNEEECGSGFECGEPGLYEAEVVDVKEKTTKDNDEMWSVRFKDVKTGETICFDNLAFGKAAKGIAFTKLKYLGIKEGADGYECNAEDLIGLRTNLTLVIDTYQGKDKLVPDFNAENFGYKLADSTDIPF